VLRRLCAGLGSWCAVAMVFMTFRKRAAGLVINNAVFSSCCDSQGIFVAAGVMRVLKADLAAGALPTAHCGKACARPCGRTTAAHRQHAGGCVSRPYACGASLRLSIEPLGPCATPLSDVRLLAPNQTIQRAYGYGTDLTARPDLQPYRLPGVVWVLATTEHATNTPPRLAVF
jgi:hypothetical protein